MNWYFSLENTDLVWFWIFASALFIQLIYVLFIFVRIFRKRKDKVERTPPVSIVICARNEEEHLKRNLPLYLNQDYPEFEVILVNDQSEDGSKPFLLEMEAKYKHLKVVEIKERTKGAWSKKVPLSIGIKGASYEQLLLTDIDCEPQSKSWIKHMMSSGDKQIVLGMAPYKVSKGFTNFLSRIDSTWMHLNMLTFALSKCPFMGIGRNLSYNTRQFYSAGGFKKHYSIPTGEDDLFINEVSNSANTQVALHPETLITCDSKSNLKGWLRQKRRQFRTTNKYRVIHKALLGTFSLSALLAWISFVPLLGVEEIRYFVLGAMTFRTLLLWLELGRMSLIMNYKGLSFFPILHEVYYILILPVLYYVVLLVKPSEWK